MGVGNEHGFEPRIGKIRLLYRKHGNQQYFQFYKHNLLVLVWAVWPSKGHGEPSGLYLFLYSVVTPWSLQPHTSFGISKWAVWEEVCLAFTGFWIRQPSPPGAPSPPPLRSLLRRLLFLGVLSSSTFQHVWNCRFPLIDVCFSQASI